MRGQRRCAGVLVVQGARGRRGRRVGRRGPRRRPAAAAGTTARGRAYSRQYTGNLDHPNYDITKDHT